MSVPLYAQVLARRVRLAQALPGVLAFLFCLTWLPARNTFDLIVTSLVGGFAFHAGGIIATLLAAYVVARVAGQENQAREFVVKDLRTTASALLFVAMYALGQHWVTRRVDDIVACARDTDTSRQVAAWSAEGRATPGAVVRWCATEYRRVRTSSADE